MRHSRFPYLERTHCISWISEIVAIEALLSMTNDAEEAIYTRALDYVRQLVLVPIITSTEWELTRLKSKLTNKASEYSGNHSSSPSFMDEVSIVFTKAESSELFFRAWSRICRTS